MNIATATQPKTRPRPLSIIVREAENEDASLMAELTRDAWADTVAPSSSGHREGSERVMRHLQDGGGYILYVDDQPAGSVRWLPVEGDSDVWEIARMGVLTPYRGENLSSALLEAVIHRALAADIKELRLAVRTEQSRLVDLYAAYGFDVAPELEYANANPAEPPPVVMRRLL